VIDAGGWRGMVSCSRGRVEERLARRWDIVAQDAH
jgi:hypothetical protein